MRIACPACAAAYDVPDERLAPGRGVRCTRCGTTWVPVPVPETAARREAPEPEPAPVVRVEPVVAEARPAIPTIVVPADPPAKRRGAGLAMAWVASVLVLTGLAVGGVLERERVMRDWPASARLYDALGLTNARPP